MFLTPVFIPVLFSFKDMDNLANLTRVDFVRDIFHVKDLNYFIHYYIFSDVPKLCFQSMLLTVPVCNQYQQFF